MHKSLIDNWSLELAGTLLENNRDFTTLDNFLFQECLGGLSNYINALLLYDDTYYVANGFERDWNRFNWFGENSSLFLKPISSNNLNINWHSSGAYSDNGISNYLESSNRLESDLFVSPARSALLKEYVSQKNVDNFFITLNKIDERIISQKESSWYKNVKIGIDNNFRFPSITQYVLNQAKNSEELFTVIMQLKVDGTINKIRGKIEEITSSTKTSTKFQKEIENLIDSHFGILNKKDKSWGLQITVLFLSITKSFSLDFFSRKEHLLFLKDIVNCRTEVESLSKDIERIFRRKLIK